MPEGDTVWRQAKLLRGALAGRVLTGCDLRVPAFATVDFTGSTVDSVDSRGKHLLVHVAGHVIHSHLSMEGIWEVYPAAPQGRSGGPGRSGSPAARWRRPAHTARAVLSTDAGTAVGFSLGLLEVVPERELENVVGHLGPDLLGPGWDAAEALRRLLAEPERPVGLALLDQQNLAGIGNIYRNELCFLAHVHPEMPIGRVPELTRLVDLAKRLLEANKDRPRRSTTGGPAAGDASSWVYGLAGKPCKRCGSVILHAKQADPAFPTRQPRDIYYCPHCQPVL
ncbi:DNA-formamidopyrimidine glycosylase family protein [Arthrobacter sp. 35W]|uniref:DNA-formamidopyrimidine glycosylase family protein n=1 Tax=Arthrobacter sp. 35W TaxID=1132441 RepID=UPI00040CA0CC|nr:DNA-formamidopyrimidine glycosylase family protein [Arthrobacter sp. 35W]